jgi:hypothetical protein
LEHNQPNQIREIDIYVVKLGKNNWTKDKDIIKKKYWKSISYNYVAMIYKDYLEILKYSLSIIPKIKRIYHLTCLHL